MYACESRYMSPPWGKARVRLCTVICVHGRSVARGPRTPLGRPKLCRLVVGSAAAPGNSWKLCSQLFEELGFRTRHTIHDTRDADGRNRACAHIDIVHMHRA